MHNNWNRSLSLIFYFVLKSIHKSSKWRVWETKTNRPKTNWAETFFIYTVSHKLNLNLILKGELNNNILSAGLFFKRSLLFQYIFLNDERVDYSEDISTFYLLLNCVQEYCCEGNHIYKANIVYLLRYLLL